jgi:hypothetical protein
MAVLAACQSSQDKARELREQGLADVAAQEGITIEQRNKEIKVVGTTLLHDQYGDAVVVELQNTSKQAQVNVPILIDLRDAKGKSVYRNDVPGLEPSLTYVPLLAPGETVDWVNDQLQPNGEPASVKVKVGVPAEPAPGQIPELAVSPPQLHEDSSGIEVEGSVTNKSQVDQTDLVIFAVARSGGKVVAAGRGQVKKLKVGTAPGRYNIFFIGDPRGAEVSVKAPPTVLQ